MEDYLFWRSDLAYKFLSERFGKDLDIVGVINYIKPSQEDGYYSNGYIYINVCRYDNEEDYNRAIVHEYVHYMQEVNREFFCTKYKENAEMFWEISQSIRKQGLQYKLYNFDPREIDSTIAEVAFSYYMGSDNSPLLFPKKNRNATQMLRAFGGMILEEMNGDRNAIHPIFKKNVEDIAELISAFPQ